MSEKKLRVLTTLDSYLPSVDGVINCLRNYAINYGDGVEVTCLVPNMGEYTDTDPFEVVRCRSLQVAKDYRWARPFQDKKMRQYIENKPFDIVHCHSPFVMAKYGIHVAKKQNIPVVATFHTDFKTIFKKIAKSEVLAQIGVERLGKVYGRMNEVFVCSSAVEQQARMYGYKGKIGYLPFGTELARCDNVQKLREEANEKYGLSNEDNVFLFVGRVVKLKRIDFILSALKKVKEKGYPFQFYIVGSGMDEKYLKSYAAKLGFTDREVIFTGFIPREDMPRLYARSNLFLFPSLYDNFALTKVEAAAYSCPCLIVKGSSTAQGLTDGVNSLLSLDSENDFAEKIIWGINHKEDLLKIGENAGEQIYKSWADSAAEVVEAYRRVIAEYQGGEGRKKS